MQEEGDDILSQLIQNPERILTPNKEATQQFLEMTSAFFEETKKSEFRKGAAGNLEKLVTEGFGTYSIWGQIKIQNDAVLRSAREEIERLKAEEEKEAEEQREAEIAEEAGEEDTDSSDDETIKALAAEQEREDAGEDVRALDEEEEEGNGEEEEIAYSDFEFDAENGIQNAHISDEDEEDPDGLAASESDDSDDVAIALAGGDVEDKEDAKHMTYADFFGDAPVDEDDEDVEKNGEDIHDKIADIEKKMMEPKPWFMMGETTAKERPKDSLLDIDIDFKMTSMLPPDPLSSQDLEALLIKRIESMNFDDVVRKKKPTEAINRFEEVSMTKSKKSLVELYEDDIRKQHGEYTEEGPTFTQQQKDAIEMWRSLEHELNKFTERRFIPRRPHDKIEVTQMDNVDAEVKPEPTKAPEEVMKATRSTKEMKGESEWTHGEKKSRRRDHKEWYGKRQEKRDAEKGILYNETGRDGAEVKLLQEVKKLTEGKLQGIETYQAGQTIPDQKEEKKDFKRNYLL